MAPPESPKNTKPARQSSLAIYLASFPGKCNATRYKSLYSEFDKLKETNPFGYEANINWWQLAILGAARNGLLSSYQPYDDSSLFSISSYTLDSGSSGGGSGSSTKPRYEPTGAAIGILELELEYLASKFYRSVEKKPQSLSTVLSEMTKKGIVIPRSDFLPWAGVGWTGWIFHKVVKTPLLWSLKQLSLSDSKTPPPGYLASPTLASTGLGSSGMMSSSSGNIGMGSGGTSTGLGLRLAPSGSSPSGYRDTYVIISFVKEAAARIHKLQQESVNYPASDNLMTFADFRQKFSRTALLPLRHRNSLSGDGVLGGAGPSIILTDRDLEILIRYMQYELKILVTGKVDESKQTNEVHDHELVIKFANKETLWDKTKQEITAADRGIIELRETIRRLEKQSSETDAEVLQSYKLGANTLASVMTTKDESGQVLLNKENVDATMDRLADVFADQQEVDQAMSDGSSLVIETAYPGEDFEDSLAAELEAMLEAETTRASSNIQTISPPKKNTSPELPITIKKTTPPLPTDPFLSPSFDSSSTTSGKRFAEIPVHANVKQRKVSQDAIHPPRPSSDELEVEDMPASIRSPEEEPEQIQSLMKEPSIAIHDSVPMDTDLDAYEDVEEDSSNQQKEIFEEDEVPSKSKSRKKLAIQCV
ncbi:hypothetical protein FBU30_008689 [Linnemannia zychae]|nr:hypothetical protein FBU30_008689 [Linnemannia zychae]